jgi:hypothetical protein
MATSVAAHAAEQPRQRPRVVLRYERSGTAAETCPDEATFRGLVAARLGYEPFVEESALALRVELQPQGGVIAGSLELTELGAARGERAMTSAPKDCYELAASLALAAAVAVDPEGVSAQTTASQPETTPPSEQPPPPPSQPPPATSPPTAPPQAETPMGVFLDAGALVSVGMQPGPAAGARLGGGLGGLSDGWSVHLEVAAFLPSERRREYGAVSSHALYGSLLPCVHPGSARITLDLCAALSLGALFSDAQGVTRSQPVTDRYTTVGARAGLSLMVSDSVGFALDAEVPVALTRVHLLVDDAGVSRQAWAGSRVGFIGGAQVVLKLR